MEEKSPRILLLPTTMEGNHSDGDRRRRDSGLDLNLRSGPPIVPRRRTGGCDIRTQRSFGIEKTSGRENDGGLGWSNVADSEVNVQRSIYTLNYQSQSTVQEA